ncbi:MAG TPA: VOC family protein, partial [Candidatus Limnocylindria bacterium]|nr:VOC family protein [Candidatus Limnocylindria bacterium]
MTRATLTPMLTVRGAAAAIDFYARAFGAREVSRHAAPTGQIVAELEVEGSHFFAVDENPAGINLSPAALGGTSVRMNLVVADPDAVAKRAIAAGAK